MNDKSRGFPKWAIGLLRKFCPDHLLEEIEGDLLQKFHHDEKLFGKKKAGRRLLWNVIRFFRPEILLRNSVSVKLIHNYMLGNYIKVGIRSLLKYRMVSAISVLGFALSMSLALPVVLMIIERHKYDDFHQNGDRIYRISTMINGEEAYATTSAPLFDRLSPSSFSFIDKTHQLLPSSITVPRENDSLVFEAALIDSLFFTTFDHEIDGIYTQSGRTIGEFDIIFSQRAALKLFGSLDIVGRIVEIKDLGQKIVVGTIDDSRIKSHIRYDAYLLLSNSTKEGFVELNDWKNYDELFVYTQLNESHALNQLKDALRGLSEEGLKLGQFSENQRSIDFLPIPLGDVATSRWMINESSVIKSLPNPAFYLIASIIILLLASFNYVNLTVSSALYRTKEIMVRSVYGASASQIYVQFIIESVLIIFASMILGVVVMYSLPLDGINQTILNTEFDIKILLGFLLFGVVIGVISGIIPSWVLTTGRSSLFNGSQKKYGGNKLIGAQKTLLTIQYTCSVLFAMVLTVFFQQYAFTVNSNYGFTRDNLVNVNLQGVNYEKLANEIGKLSQVENISATSNNFGRFPGDVWIRNFEKDINISVGEYSVNENFIENFNLKLLHGRNFPMENQGYPERFIVINEKASTALGFDNNSEAIGKTIYVSDTIPREICGVIKDFNFDNFKRAIRPMILQYAPENYRFMTIRVSNLKINSASLYEHIDKSWKLFSKTRANYESYDEMFKEDRFYKKDMLQIGTITSYTIFLTYLGLLGMIVYNSRKKAKEVAIRKVLGARTGDITRLLRKNFVLPFALSVVIALPLGYFICNQLLSQFVYKIEIGIGSIAPALLITLILGFAVMWGMSMLDSKSSPIKFLREE